MIYRNQCPTQLEIAKHRLMIGFWELTKIAEINKALCAVSCLVDQGNQVIFDQDEKTGVDTPRIVSKKTGNIIRLVRDRNVWTIDAYIEEDANDNQGFHWRG